MPGLGLNGALHMGARSLTTQRLATEVAGHNLANVNTPNSARQRVNIQADITVKLGIGQQGTGSYAIGIQSLRSQLLDNQVVLAQSLTGFYTTKNSLASLAQEALGENLTTSQTSGTQGSGSRSGLQSSLDGFFDAWQDLGNDPTSTIARNAVVSRAQIVTNDLQAVYNRLLTTQSGIATQASNTTSAINELAADIAQVNGQIVQAEAGTKSPANDLRDTRQELIEKMAKLVNINVTNNANGTVTITLADDTGVTLVDEDDAGGAGITETLSTTYNTSANPPLVVVGSVSGALTGANIPKEGELGAQLAVSNTIIGSGVTVGNTGLLGDLDNLALDLVSVVNTQHALGYDRNGTAGGAFFTAATTGASDITIAAAVVANSNLIAAAGDDGGGASLGPLDATNARALADLRGNASLGLAYRQVVATLGLDVQQADRQEQAQALIQNQLLKQREAISGISIDEEMTNLIGFQRAYDASARFISIIDAMLDRLVNGTAR